MNIFWFRRDLRLEDNTGLFHALREGHKVQPIFIFDKLILDKLAATNDPRVCFIYDQILRLKQNLMVWVLTFGFIMEIPWTSLRI